MDKKYKFGIITKKNRRMFEAWDRADPVDEWEREKQAIIKRIQNHRKGQITNSWRARVHCPIS